LVSFEGSERMHKTGRRLFESAYYSQPIGFPSARFSKEHQHSDEEQYPRQQHELGIRVQSAPVRRSQPNQSSSTRISEPLNNPSVTQHVVRGLQKKPRDTSASHMGFSTGASKARTADSGRLNGYPCYPTTLQDDTTLGSTISRGNLADPTSQRIATNRLAAAKKFSGASPRCISGHKGKCLTAQGTTMINMEVRHQCSNLTLPKEIHNVLHTRLQHSTVAADISSRGVGRPLYERHTSLAGNPLFPTHCRSGFITRSHNNKSKAWL